MSISTPSKHPILVLGAGELGACVLRELARLRDQGRAGPVSVLLRPRREPAADSATADLVADLGIDVVHADLAAATVDELAAIFSAYRQVICCSGFVGGAGTQRKITDAVLRAGVAHYIPWQFGVDYDVVGRGSGQAVWDEQLDVRDMLRGQDRVRWTIVSTGMFTSFVLLPEFGLVDLEGGVVRALGDWDFRLTVTTPRDIGRLTALIATARPAYDDDVVYVAGDTFTYRELADTVERVLRRPVRRELWSLDRLEADAATHPGDTFRAYRVSFARADGVAWPMARTFNAAQGLPVTGLEAWLRAWHEGGAASDRP
ncbi:aromatic alcohol reductase [Bordetella genomosp. 13]|uniref:aromatic alcohol reductase n=1 Tax=Bordetella genomosp. 13 TaxID=463040 RepID=UPI0011A1913B|nr:aromatic alcohol reductase [Bordetella genomosp. 13]